MSIKLFQQLGYHAFLYGNSLSSPTFSFNSNVHRTMKPSPKFRPPMRQRQISQCNSYLIMIIAVVCEHTPAVWKKH